MIKFAKIVKDSIPQRYVLLKELKIDFNILPYIAILLGIIGLLLTFSLIYEAYYELISLTI